MVNKTNSDIKYNRKSDKKKLDYKPKKFKIKKKVILEI